MSRKYLKLRAKIRECGITQADLAYCIGMSSSTLSAKLNGKSEFSEKEIAMICCRLGIDAAHIADFFCLIGLESQT